MISAVWRVMQQVTFTFLYGNDKPVLPTRVTSMTLKAPNGTLVAIMNPAELSNLWFDQGSYNVVNVTVFSVNTAIPKQAFITAPDANIHIGLNLFDVKFTVQDAILRAPIVGGEVNVTMPNGQSQTAAIIQGQASIYQLPTGTYRYAVSNGWGIGASGTVDLNDFSTTYPIEVDIIMMPSIGLIAAGIAIGVAALLFFRKRRVGFSSTSVKRKHKRRRISGKLSPELRTQLSNLNAVQIEKIHSDD
jgi:hypothetical protein